jgi:hypothetical protein
MMMIRGMEWMHLRRGMAENGWRTESISISAKAEEQCYDVMTLFLFPKLPADMSSFLKPELEAMRLWTLNKRCTRPLCVVGPYIFLS